MLELVSKLPTTLEEVTALRRKFSRKTTQCLSELLSIISRAVSRIREDERNGAKPAAIRVSKSEPAGQNKAVFVVNELKADDSIAELAIQLSSMSVTIDETPAAPASHQVEDELEAELEDMFMTRKPRLIQRVTPAIKFDSLLGYLKELYPTITIAPVKRSDGKIEDELGTASASQLPEKLISDDFIGIGDKKMVVQDQGEERDIVEKVDHSLLPASLKEKFKTDLLKIKKKDFTTKVVEKKQGKTNTLQSTSREIFEKGNVFEVLKSKAVDQMSDEEGSSRFYLENEQEEEQPKAKSFWDAYNEATQKHQANNSKDAGPKVGEFGGSNKNKKKKDKGKTAQFNKPSVRSAIKF